MRGDDGGHGLANGAAGARTALFAFKVCLLVKPADVLPWVICYEGIAYRPRQPGDHPVRRTDELSSLTCRRGHRGGVDHLQLLETTQRARRLPVGRHDHLKRAAFCGQWLAVYLPHHERSR